VQIYINYEYTQTDKIDAVETFHETSLQFQRKDTFFRIQNNKIFFLNVWHIKKKCIFAAQIKGIINFSNIKETRYRENFYFLILITHKERSIS